MEGPTLVLVPPTPVRKGLPPLPTAAANSRLGSFEKERGSSETTIFTIYSMYGDESARQSEESTSNEAIPRSRLTNGSGDHASLYCHSGSHQSARSMNTDGIYCDTSSESRLSSKYTSAVDLPARTSVVSDRSVRLSYLDDRPLPTRASSSGLRNNAQQPLDTLRLPKTSDLARSTLRASFTFPDTGASTGARLRQPLSPPPSTSRVSSNGDTSTPHPRPIPSRTRTPELLAPPKSPLTLLHNNSPGIVSPASKSSLVPSEGEDFDAFHVRNTYAEIEMTGVKGDGYEEGVERTRARVGGSRASELIAEGALDDGTEKTRELSPQELETLASLDRYGFFTIPSHDRLVLLSSAPLTKRLTRVSAGPKSRPTNATSLSSLPPAPHPTKETSRISKWNRMLEPRARDEGGNIVAWGVKPSKEQKLRERAYKGIPDRWRRAAWDLLMGRFSRTGKRELLQLSEEYRDALEKPSTYDVQIDLDVPRTISGHIMFRTRYGSGQRSLFHVLHSFSLRCTQCGYVQGMGPIAATLLCYFEPEHVYASLVRLHDAYAMHTIFSPGFPGLLEAIYVQERITEQMMPDVYVAFKSHMISTMSYATKWYITLFANSVPFQTQLRLWDVFLFEGQDVFVAVAVAIVWVYRDNITSGAANFETVLSLLSSFFIPEDEDALLSWIGKMLGNKKLRSSMSQWREDWKTLVATGKDGTALL